MEYVCEAPHNRTWFRLVTEGEAIAESLEMKHAVEKHYRREWVRATRTHIRNMPMPSGRWRVISA